MKLTKKRLMENAGLVSESIDAASEALSLLAHPDFKKQIETLYDMLDDAQVATLKKAYDGLYNELKKYE